MPTGHESAAFEKNYSHISLEYPRPHDALERPGQSVDEAFRGTPSDTGAPKAGFQGKNIQLSG